MIKVADFIINTLAERGIDKMFVVYGAANGDLIDAFTRTGSTEYVAVMHEQAGGFAAEGICQGQRYSRSGDRDKRAGRNESADRYGQLLLRFDSLRVSHRPDQFAVPPTDPSIRQIGFQETDIVAMAAPVTKYAKMIVKAGRCPV